MSNFAQYLSVILLNEAQSLKGEQYSGSFFSLANRLTVRLNGVEITPTDVRHAIDILLEFAGAKEYEDPLTGGYYQINYDNFRYYFIQEEPDFLDADKDGYKKLRAQLLKSRKILVTFAENGSNFAEDVIKHLEQATAEQVVTLRGDNFSEMVSASDRLVPLNHNSAGYQEIREGLDQLFEHARSSNELGASAEEKARLVHSLDVARKLWSMNEIKLIQVQVGVVMAIEDVGRALEKIGRSTGFSLLVDLVKKFVKDEIGIDF